MHHDPNPISPPAPLVDVDGSDLQLPSTILSEGEPLGARAPAPSTEETSGFACRYEIHNLIGKGGMGEVRACRDRVIGRDVAIKRIRADRVAQGAGRFLREARIQGQLEHPAVLPVYDLGAASDGDPYFTMKRVRGQSLAEVLCAKREGAPDTMSERRLLTLFSQVCLAADFIHARGVVHRDLKPANIMLGRYGEVYLLDWGLAKIVHREDADPEGTLSAGLAGGTLDGVVLGTPGYMAPEQLRGESASVDHRADVYSLGAILFELLSGEPLHAGGNMEERVLSTLRSDGARPSGRGAEIASELDELTARATRLDPEQRLPSAKAMSDAIEAFLDGARDAQRRRELAHEHVERARAALAASFDEGADEPAERALAMRAVTRALGLDPENPDAIRTLMQLLTQPPRETPPAAEEAFRDAKGRMVRAATRATIGVYLAYILYVPFPFILGVRSFAAFAVLACGTLSCLCVAVHQVTRARRLEDARLHLSAAALTAALSTVVFGPLILVPTLAMGVCLAYTAAFPAHWVRGTVVCCFSFAAPFVLHLAGVLPDTLRITEDAIVTGAWLMAFPTVPTAVFLVISHVAIIATGCWYVAHTQSQHDEARRALHVQAWHLEQIVPTPATAR